MSSQTKITKKGFVRKLLFREAFIWEKEVEQWKFLRN